MHADGVKFNIRHLHIFPEEIWKLIIDQIENSVDRFHILVCLPELSSVLHNQKPKWYFGIVLPMIGRYLPTASLRTTRQVCKTWHHDLHNSIDHHPYHLPYNADPQNGLPLNTAEVNKNCSLFKLATSSPILKFRTVGSIHKFTEMLAKSQFSRQRIYGRTMLLDPDRTNSQEEFNEISIELLRNVGSEINHLTLGTHRDFETAIQFYKRLRLILEFTPNLKSLSIQFENQHDIRSLSLLMARRPLPSLRFLQSIRMDYHSKALPKNIFECILSLAARKESCVRKLVIPGLLYSPEITNYTSTFSNIIELEICHAIDAKLLPQLNGSKLQKLVAHNTSILPHSDTIAIDISGLRVLHSHDIYLYENCVRLPNLHTLRFMDRQNVNYNFLLKLPSLTKLEIMKDVTNKKRRLNECQGFGDGEITKDIVMWIYSSPLKSPPVWNWLPTLKKIRIYSFNKYTRQLSGWATFCRH